MKLLIGSAFVVAGLLLTKADAVGGPDQTLDARVNATLRDWQTITPEFLRDPSNHELFLALKDKAKSPNQVKARIMLLNAEEPSAIELCFADLHQNNAYQRADAGRVFEQCNQPRLIVLLASDLNRQESATALRINAGEEVIRLTPISVFATQAIIGIILNSRYFSEDVKAWASKVPAQGSRDDEHDTARTAVRKWWQENETLIRFERYGQVRPPKS
jgi:hypothetical protein